MFTFDLNYRVHYSGSIYENDPLMTAPVPEGHEHYGVPLYQLWNMPVEVATEISNTEKWKQVRTHRDKLLNETDWWGVSDRTMSEEQKAYRQALRDITNQNDIENIVWPTKPE